MTLIDPPAAEESRLHALWELRILDTPAEPRFDRLTRLTADIFGAPTALVSLIDRDRQWFKSRHGFDACETDRESAFCNHAIALPAGSVMVVPDATADPRFADNPHVVGEAHVRFYAGAVLTDSAGYNLGTLCIIDTRTRPDFDEDARKRLRTLADIVEEQIELTRDRLAAEQRRQLLEMAEAVASIGHWRWEMATGRIHWSAQLRHVFGVEQAFDPNLEAVRALYAPDDRERHDAFVERAMQGAVGGVDLALDAPGEDHRYVHARALREIGTDGQTTALFGIVQDVTERYQATQRLMESEAALRQAKERAEAAAEVKSRFLATMSHELRTPLTSIIGFSGILQASEGLSALQRQCADRINVSGQALLSVINDILDYSKLEAGALRISLAPFDLHRVLAETEEILSGQMEAKGLSFTLDVADDVPQVLQGDGPRIRQILLNLVGNAVKFTERGGIRVAVNWQDRQEGGRLRFAVSDTGIGIDPEAGLHLFERFFQAEAGADRRHGGTGLGLAIVRELVELMDGRLGLESVPDEGSTFWFELPLDAPAGGGVG